VCSELNDEKKINSDGQKVKAQNGLSETQSKYLIQAQAMAAATSKFRTINTNPKQSEEAKQQAKQKCHSVKKDLHLIHNEYILKLNETNFVEGQHVNSIKRFLTYHEDTQNILSNSWKTILEKLADYTDCTRTEFRTIVDKTYQITKPIEPKSCYLEFCKNNSNCKRITARVEEFNDSLLKTAGVDDLYINKIAADILTIEDLNDKLKALSSNEKNCQIPTTINQKAIGQVKNSEDSYKVHKDIFVEEQNIESLQAKSVWQRQVRSILEDALSDSGATSGQLLDNCLTNKLEDQPYFHGIMPRQDAAKELKAKGDFLVRVNDKEQCVLSLLWTRSNDPSAVEDRHFVINFTNNKYSFVNGGAVKPSVKELIDYYLLSKEELKTDGTKLIRPVERPGFIIDNDEIIKNEKLGQGNFGQVVKAEYRKRNVAVKILHMPSNPNKPTAQM
ncbi:unnamed protein product, partial [Didymodactylos carnosus]